MKKDATLKAMRKGGASFLSGEEIHKLNVIEPVKYRFYVKINQFMVK